MIFLIEYNRPEGRIVTFDEFSDFDRTKAEDLRFEKEIDLRRKSIDHEIVILEADSIEALHKTHCRYFKDYAEIGKSILEAL